METAKENIETSSAVKVESETLFGDFLVIATPDLYYEEEKLTGSESWIKQEGNYWYEYFTGTEIVGDHPAIIFAKRLSLDITEDPRAYISSDMEEYPSAKFSKATKKDGKLTIVYKEVEDGTTTKITYTIVKGKLKSIKVKAGAVVMTTNFQYGNSAMSELPALPTGVEWDEYEPYIEVENLKRVYNVREQLDLTNAVVNYYEDDETTFPDEFVLTSDMVSNFSTETTGNFTMTITFYGVTLNIDYRVDAVQ